MAVEQGVGYKVVKTLASEPVNKTYLKVKQAEDFSVKNYQDVKETDGTDKDYIEVVIVNYDEPKDFLLVNYLDAVTPAISRKYYSFGGSGDYISMPELNIVAGDSIEIKFIGKVGGYTSWVRFIQNSSNTHRVYISSSDKLTSNYFDMELDGVSIPSGTLAPADGIEHILKLTATDSCTLSAIGATSSGSNSISTPMWDVSIQSAGGNRFYPVDDVDSTVKDLVSGQDGTLENYNAVNWLDEL